MIVTREREKTQNRNYSAPGDTVGRKKTSSPTVLVRIHKDVDDMSEMLCGVFKKSKPDFISDLLRPLLEKMRKEAADRIRDFKMGP